MSLSDRDRQVIWHPYTPMKLADPAIGIVKAKDAVLYAEDGREYIDANASWWVNLHGHAHPHIAKVVAEQLNTLEHVIFAGFTHEPAVALAERLLPYLPGGQTKAFYSDNGSTAVEVALKMAIQYWGNKGQDRREIVALRDSYHGDTFGAMSVSERGAFTAPFKQYLFDIQFIDKPLATNQEAVLSQLEGIIQQGRTAAIILEPLLMGVAGMHIYHPEVLEAMFQLCKKYDVLVIADEVFTGFGRTGRWFACQHADGLEPDMVCLSKGLTGGTMAMGLTTCKQHVFDAFYTEDRAKTLFHGHSYTANPVACAAALASLDLMEQDETWQQINRITDAHVAFAAAIDGHPRITDLRTLGTMLAFEVNTGEANSYFHNLRDEMYRFFLSQGVLIRPMGNTVYVLPPYCITDAQLKQVYAAIVQLLDKLK